MGDQDQSTLKKSHRYDLFTISTNNQKCVLRKKLSISEGNNKTKHPWSASITT